MMEDYTVEQLRQIARNKNLRGYSRLRKTDLIKFIKSPKKGSPKRVSPRKGSPKKGSPKRVSPKKGSPKRVSLDKKSPKITGRKNHTKASKFTSLSTRDKIINAKLQGIDWFIVTMEGCIYCDDAKKLLKKHKLRFNTQMLTQTNKDTIYESIDNMTKKYRYFPIIFYKGEFLGGYTELKKKLS